MDGQDDQTRTILISDVNYSLCLHSVKTFFTKNIICKR